MVTAGSSASSAAKHQTSTIPIVFINVGNPIGIGLVKSLNHPGGNVTGFTDAIADLSGCIGAERDGVSGHGAKGETQTGESGSRS